ncbi:MAG: DUF448 domain-containing protein [Deltaproteobacteria bacterium]|nr:DUF448 domain-containing protein [Deltaproteobacteria bacterium]
MTPEAEKRPPLRTCLICRQKRAKGELTRFVLDGDVRIEDAKQRLPGRGYYVCAGGDCREQWLRRAARGRGRARSGCSGTRTKR